METGINATELKSQQDILTAQRDGKLTMIPTQMVVNCPFVKWHENGCSSSSSLPIRTNATLTDETPYGQAQVLNIDISKMQVVFVAH